MSVLSLPTVGDAPQTEVPLYDERNLARDLLVVGRNRLAERVTGGLSSPGKMPTYAWGLSAARCRMGSLLGEHEGTVCHPSVCYAKKRNYKHKGVQAKLEERWRGLFHVQDGVPLWTPSMIYLVNYMCDKYFRLFDSGDLADENHYRNIITLAQHAPEVTIWMPSREIRTIQNVHREMIRDCIEFPKNLIPRISANLIDGKPPAGFPFTSSVVSDPEQASCVAQLQHNKCDGEVASCRACWEDDHVSYPLH